ncbi:MAG: NHLP bacteriocin export ABC transporter permease/ATPase subunit [Actinomycetota bacterium]
MGFNIFDDQINTRRENDEAVFSDACCGLASILDPVFSGKNSNGEVRGAIAKVLSMLEAEVPEVPENITDLNAQLTYMLRPSGVMRRRVELKGDWWKDATGCLLGSTSAGEVVVISQNRYSGYEYCDIKGKTIKINRRTAKNINTDAFYFYRALPAKKLRIMDLVLFMLKAITRDDIVFVLVVSLLVSLTGMFMPYMNKQIFDGIIPSGIKSNILPVASLLTGVLFGSTIFGIARGIILARLRDKINISVQSATMMRVFALPANFFKPYTTGELSSRVMSMDALCSVLSDAVLTTGLSAVFSFVFIFQMLRYAPTLVIPGMLCLIFMMAFSVLTSFIQLKISRRLMKLSARQSGLIYSLFTGIQKIKLAGAEKRAFAKWAERYKEQGRLSYAPPMFLRLNSAISVLITLGSSLVLFYFAGTSKISPADYMAFNVAYGAVSGAIMALSGIAMTAVNIKPLLEMVQPIIEAVPENSKNKKIVTSLSGVIEINSLSFRYESNSPLILDNISLKIKSGEYVAIAGRTGCGKSTLFRLLLGFEKPETGAIYYDGQDLEKIDASSLRQCIAVDMQGGKLFPGSIFSNIIIGAPWMTLNDAWEAAKLAGVDEDIRAMPMNMHTVISEGNGGISGGQRQRILIARAVVSKPKIILLDEATSALDNITQKHVSESIEKLKSTRLVIAHRLSTIQHCDRIIVLESGRIAEDGNYDELIAKQGLFYDLAKRQTL